MKKITILLLLLFGMVTVPAGASVQPESGDDIYTDVPAPTNQTIRLWKAFLPYLLEYCRKDVDSPVTINGRKIGKYFGSEFSTLEAINFGIGHLRYSLIRGITDYSGFAFVRYPQSANVDTDVRFVLMYDPGDMSVFEKAFKKIFRINLLSRKIPAETSRLIPDPPSFYKKLKDRYFYAYNPAAIEKAFLSIYVTPDASLFGYSTQVLYDSAFKEYFRELSYVTALLFTRKEYIAKCSGEYMKLYREDSKFHAVGFTWKCTDTVLNTSLNHPLMQKFRKLYPGGPYAYHLELFSNRIMGILLRRSADNSLGIVLKIVRTVLHDYDNELYTELKEYLVL